MTALVLAALLAQPVPATAMTPQSDASAVPAPDESPIVRRLPISAPHVESGDAVIRNSGSTNTSGFTIVVHPDFSVDVYEGGTTRHTTLAAPQAKWLFAKLKGDEPLGALEGGHCMKSASFGSVTSIAYDGQMTTDLSCPGGAEVLELGRTAGVIVQALGVTPMTGRFRRSPL